MALTDTFVKSVKWRGNPAGEKYSDGGGLYLHVKESGLYWRLSYRHLGKQKTLALGVYNAVSLAQARAGRNNAKALLAAGTDPGEAKRKQMHAKMAAAANTFKSIALEWQGMKSRSGWSDKTRDTWRCCLNCVRCRAIPPMATSNCSTCGHSNCSRQDGPIMRRRPAAGRCEKQPL